MINVGNSSIENILVGDTQVDKVYLGTDVVWEHLQNHHDYVEIGGIQWATINVGANNVTDTGLYFLWGDTQGYAASLVGTDKQFSWSDYKYTNDGGSTMTKYNSTDNKTALEPSDDAATAALGDRWRMPTTEEYVALRNAIRKEWTNNYQGSGVAGMICIDNTDSSKVLFFPAVGYCNGSNIVGTNTYCFYWSDTVYTTEIYRAFNLYSVSNSTDYQYISRRFFGFPVRAVHVRDYLKFTALESGTFTLTIPAAVNTSYITSISYSLDNGVTWVTTLNSSSAITITTPTVAQGGTVLWKGSGIRTAVGSNNNQYSLFSSTANFAASGNIMSLLYEDTFENQLIISEPYCFGSLFKGCSKITTAPELPATTLSGHCYENMFLGCTALTAAPGLPATTLAGYCYSAMFGNCSSLATAPTILPATTLYEFCYNYMFSGCSSLTIAPELPATILVSNCYRFMFNNCRALIRIKCLATDISATLCVDRWVQNVNSNAGTFVKNEDMSSWPTGSSGIPANWTVVDYNS